MKHPDMSPCGECIDYDGEGTGEGRESCLSCDKIKKAVNLPYARSIRTVPDILFDINLEDFSCYKTNKGNSIFDILKGVDTITATMFVQYFFLGMNYQEIAEYHTDLKLRKEWSFGISKKAVLMRLSRLKKDLEGVTKWNGQNNSKK